MRDYVSIYVPGTVDGSRLDPKRQARETAEVAEAFTARFGGCYVTSVDGYWADGQGDAIREPIRLVKSFTSWAADDVQWVERIAGRLAEDMGQASVAIEVCGNFRLIAPPQSSPVPSESLEESYTDA